MKKSLWALLFSTLLLSCKEETPVPSKTDLLTGKTWKWVAGSISPAYDIFGIGVLVGDGYFTRVPECWRDDRWVFSTAQKFTHEEGTTRCNIGDPQIYIQGTWAFEPGETSIRIKKDGSGEFVWTVHELTSTSLLVAETFKENGKTYTISYSFGH
ncbi:hypothetical protein [Runella sp.]|uniref:hypothetical protein n=1 Tax=Runella sp. TaxID=1960881 RepID=UPI003019C67E